LVVFGALISFVGGGLLDNVCVILLGLIVLFLALPVSFKGDTFERKLNSSSKQQMSTQANTSSSHPPKKTPSEQKSIKDEEIPSPAPERHSVVTKIEDAVESLKKENVDITDIEVALQEGNMERAIHLLDSKTSNDSKSYSIESKIKESVEILKEEEEHLDTRRVEKALDEGDVEKANELLAELEERYEEYKETLSELKELDRDKSSLARKLAKDEIDRETYQDAKREIEHEKAELEEKLQKLREEVIYEDYEKPF